MQTFLPYPDFKLSAVCLDNKRLGKQRVEAFQILQALLTSGYGWKNHPAVKMWQGYESALCDYYSSIVNTWLNRGFSHSMPRNLHAYFSIPRSSELPHWLGDSDFHSSHRANLLRKDFAFYSKHGWSENQNLPYIWPKGKF